MVVERLYHTTYQVRPVGEERRVEDMLLWTAYTTCHAWDTILNAKTAWAV